ncbi:hypothetical protein [Salinimicrobium soli]|uniref:hypothetical protein n=1 Tax=Salinimicrobium soli TaxID=1254399 RepID=UPI003AAFB6F1
MRHFKLMLIAFAMTMVSAYANNDYGKKQPVSAEIQKMLTDSDLSFDENFTVTIYFKVSDDHRIEVQAVQSPNEEVNEFLQKRLQNQKLHGANWNSEKVYELPVRVQAVR